jgi:hypothetical protein
MSVRFLNPHNVKHGTTAVEKCVEARVENRIREAKRLYGDGSAWPKRVAAIGLASEIHLVTEDVVTALSIAPGTTATLTFDAADAEGGSDKTVSCANAVYLGPVGELGDVKAGAGRAVMHFVCWSAGGGNPISIS